MTILTDWKVPTKKLLAVMYGATALTFGVSMVAWWQAAHGATTGFWHELHATYWRLYVIFGALVVPAAAWLMREPS